MKTKLTHSIIVPIYNDQDVVQPFYEKMCQVFSGLEDDIELIYVDDASVDRTFEELMSLRAKDPRVKVLRMSRNFGHQVSLLAGMDYATGDTVISLDGDLQHPPELLPALIQHFRDGYDVVYTTRVNNPHETVVAGLLSKTFYKVFNAFTRLGIDPGIADFRLLSRRAARVFCELREAHRFNRGLVSWIGFKQIAVPYAANERTIGKSKFNLTKRLRLAFDGLFSFTVFPLRFAAFLGSALALLSFLYGISVIAAKLAGETWPAGWATLTAAIMFFGGLQLFFLGILGEYIGRIYQESKKRPLYVVDRLEGLVEKHG